MQGAGLKSYGLRALSKRYSPDEHAASGMVLRLSTRETMSLITSMGSEFQPLFRRMLLGSAIVSAWVSDKGGGRRHSGDGSLDEIMCGQRWRSEYVLREVDR